MPTLSHKIVNIATAGIVASENSVSPADYENAGAGARYAASQLNDLIYPATAQVEADSLITALRNISIDSTKAVPVPGGGNLIILTQTFRSDLTIVNADVGTLVDDLG